MAKDIELFLKRSRELFDLQSILQSLAWDQETMMPPKGAALRAGQISTLASLYHQKLLQPDWGELLDGLEEQDSEIWEKASLREMRRRIKKATQVPNELVKELAETTSLAYQLWVEARQESDFSKFAPTLQRVVALKREEARCLQESNSLYEALLDEYEPEMTTQKLDSIFTELRPQLSELLGKIQQSSSQPDLSLLRGGFSQERQEEFGREVLTAMGFDWQAGRMDTSPHPFCSGLTPFDVRITTRYSERDFTSAFFGVVHEGGHALYEQGLGKEHVGLPACEAISLGIHESQSRLWENQVGRSRPFWKHWLPRLRLAFPGQFKEARLEEFVHAVNRVEASFIRVEADEVTYGLHVILRYELEKDLIEGDLEVVDLERAWDEKMDRYLGLRPSSSAQGVLQDTHWSQGLIGYFPTYLLGNLYAAQVYHQARQSIPSLEEKIEEGNLLLLREWLLENIHSRGKTVTASELIQDVSGGPLNAQFFITYLKEKFGTMYRLN